MFDRKDLLKIVVGVMLWAAVAAGLYFGNVQTAVGQALCYQQQGGAMWVAASGCEWEAQQGSTLDVQGNLQLTSATQVVTGSFTVLPVAPVMVLTSTLAVTSDATAAITTTNIGTGQTVILRNGNASNAITIDGTGGTVECKANVVMGAGDTLMLIFNGTDWNCLSSYDNS